MNSDDLFTAPQVAKICSTDLKTIHNWVNRGEIRSFRTPGRHLRFRRQDILEFLDRFGYPIPDGFTPTRQRVVLYEAKDTFRRSLKRSLARDFEVEAFSDHVDALLAIGKQQPSLVLLSALEGTDIYHMVERLSSDKTGSPVAVYGDKSKEKDFATGLDNVEFIASDDSKEIRRRVASMLVE
jgi:excisionase family DNA binding protein